MTALDDEYRGNELAGLQPERTALAWERTSFAMMVAGLLMGRYPLETYRWLFVPIGIAQIVAGIAVLIWARVHYRGVHGRIENDDPVVHPTAARIIGIGTVTFSAFALLSVLIAIGST